MPEGDRSADEARAARRAAALRAARAKAGKAGKGDETAPPEPPPGTPIERFKQALLAPVPMGPPPFTLYWDDLTKRNIAFASSKKTWARYKLIALKAAAATRYNSFVERIFPTVPDFKLNANGGRLGSTRDVPMSSARFLWLVIDDTKSYEDEMANWMRATMPKPVEIAQKSFLTLIEEWEKIQDESLEHRRVGYLLADAYAAFQELLSSRQTSTDDQRAVARFLLAIGLEQPEI